MQLEVYLLPAHFKLVHNSKLAVLLHRSCDVANDAVYHVIKHISSILHRALIDTRSSTDSLCRLVVFMMPDRAAFI